jgi:uncharacterized protein YrrD
MNSQDMRGLTVISLADGTQVGTIDQVYLDLAAKQVVGFSITNGVGPYGGTRDTAPTVATSEVHALGPDGVTLDDVAAAHAAWVGAAYGRLETLDDVVGRTVVTVGGISVGEVAAVGFDGRTFAITEMEVSPGFVKSNTHIPRSQLVRFGSNVLVVADVAPAVRGDLAANSIAATVVEG